MVAKSKTKNNACRLASSKGAFVGVVVVTLACLANALLLNKKVLDQSSYYSVGDKDELLLAEGKRQEMNPSSSLLFYPSDEADAFFKRVTTAGTTTHSIITASPRKLVQTEPGKEFITCNAPKTGCTAWNYFWEFVNTGRRWNSSQIENDSGIIYRHYDGKSSNYFGNRSDSEIVTMLTNYEMITIGRNPYVRFLSSYQDWLARSNKKETEVPFDKFTNEFLKLKMNGDNQFFHGTLVDHIDTVSKYCQIGTYNYTLLRVEEQALWFNRFVTKYHLKEKMDEYTSYGNLVFSSGIRENSYIKDFTAQISGKESWPSDVFKSSHHRGSAEKFAKYYTPDIAKMVTYIVFDDLVNFGYPLWDGVADNFRFV